MSSPPPRDAGSDTTAVGRTPVPSSLPAPPSVVVLRADRSAHDVGRRVPIGERLVVGRLPDCGLVLVDDAASRRHAELVAHGGSVEVRDLGSRNGTYLNDRRVGDLPEPLRDGDRLTLGATILKFIDTDADNRFHEVLYRLKVEDPLTRLRNKRFLFDFLEREVARALRRGLPLSVVLFDLDHFKAVNDRHGHLAGDVLLREVASAAQALVRDDECLARFGGEEFALILPDAPAVEAVQVAERLRAAIGGVRATFEGVVLAATASAGVASLGEAVTTSAGLLAAADAALYGAKALGRDRVACAP